MTSVSSASEDSEDDNLLRPSEEPPLESAITPPLEPLPIETQTPQERYAEQLHQDIERLEAIKASLQANIATLQTNGTDLRKLLIAKSRLTYEI